MLQSVSSIVDILFTFGLAQFLWMDYIHCKSRPEKRDLLDGILSLYSVFGTLFFFLTFLFLHFLGFLSGEGINGTMLALMLTATFFNFFQNLLITIFRLRVS